MSMHNDHGVEEEHGLQPMQYVWIGLLLTIITIVELGASLWVDLGNMLIPVLIVLSAVKFVIVVAYYMHLRFEHRLLSQVFTGSFVLAAGVLIALIALFWTDITNIVW